MYSYGSFLIRFWKEKKKWLGENFNQYLNKNNNLIQKTQTLVN